MNQETDKLYAVFKKYKGHERISEVCATYMRNNRVVDHETFEVPVRAKYQAEHIIRMISLRVSRENVGKPGLTAEVAAFGGYRNVGGGMHDVSETICKIS